MTTAVLGIDAAWTSTELSGIALVVGEPGAWRCAAASPSYPAFVALAAMPQSGGTGVASVCPARAPSRLGPTCPVAADAGH